MRLHINIDHVATVRQARRTDEPDPVRAAMLAELGGADGITVHLREDRRHIQDRDVRLLMATARTGVNLEMAATEEMSALAVEIGPMAATLVPERREEVTTEGGLSLEDGDGSGRLRAVLDRLLDGGIKTALFIDPDPDTISAAADLGVAAIELHTGGYANDWRPGRDASEALERLRAGAERAAALGLHVHAGHGLTYENVRPVAGIREIEELNIGHSVVSRAVLVGMERAVREMKDLVLEARRQSSA
ncbi:MAG TPA: pyridoxine 5'-phosphate synthase [Longimicrobiales bacterium]|nr:pyridoxine 5'-phosphate synthase [Longimicrobiales bacterium]